MARVPGAAVGEAVVRPEAHPAAALTVLPVPSRDRPEPVSSTGADSEAWSLTGDGTMIPCSVCFQKWEEGQVPGSKHTAVQVVGVGLARFSALLTEPWEPSDTSSTPVAVRTVGPLLHGWAGLADTKEGGWLGPWTLCCCCRW